MANPWFVVEEDWPTVHPTGVKEFPYQAASQSAIPLNMSYVAGPFTSQAAAQAYISNPSSGASQSGGVVSPSPEAPQSQANVPTPSLSNPLAPLADIGNFFHELTQLNTWIRVAEVGVGIILVYVGVKALASNTAVGRAGGSVKKAAKKTVSTAAKAAAPEKTAATAATSKVTHIVHHRAPSPPKKTAPKKAAST